MEVWHFLFVIQLCARFLCLLIISWVLDLLSKHFRDNFIFPVEGT